MNVVALRFYFGLVVSLALALPHVLAATKTVDLDGSTANGAESQCDLNVLQTFPVKIENKITNKAIGAAFNFSWKSAGPGGFSSSVTSGTTGGVGAKWVWTTNQTVYAYTGTSCPNDVCFGQTSGPGPANTCTLSCLADGAVAALSRGTNAGEIVLSWTGGQGPFTVYRSVNKVGVVSPSNAVGTTDLRQVSDVPPAGDLFFYVVRGTDCTARKPCATNLDCDPVTEGTCVNRGPFAVPGRSLFSNDVTVSSSSLTSSLITFFSPPTELFSVTSIAQPGALQETLTNNTTAPVTVITEDYPEGCCPIDPFVPDQLRCGDDCVDFLNDPENCGACGTTCGDGTCCSDGRCASLCPEGRTWCDGACVDFQNDSANCGECGSSCDDGTCCLDGACASACDAGELWCDGQCADVQDDSANCGACGNVCGEGTCCSDGVCASVCDEGQTWCDGVCADLQNDSGNCGACGNACGGGTCCSQGVCASVCADGQVWCDGQCADVQDDSANCGACGNACGDGTCCFEGNCASVCDEGQVWCNGQCADFQNDSANCGACGNVCGESTCCVNGVCASVCDDGQAWCDGQCADFQNDSANCGGCGIVCGDGTCCSEGICASVCDDGRTFCDGLCYDLQNDPSNCGACGNVCSGESICTGGACVACTGQGGARSACDNRCVNIRTDPYNCGGCGISCNDNCPSNFTGVCSNGQSCTCVAGTPPPPPPPNTPQPTPPVCPNPDPSEPVAGVCANPNPTSPVDGVCPNPEPSQGPVAGVCPNPDPTAPVGGVCPNPDPSPGPHGGVCPNENPASPTAGVCPSPGSLPPPVDPTPNCQAEGGSTTIPPGGSVTTCLQGGLVYKEIATVARVCGDGIPGPDGSCADGISRVSEGTFMRFVPDTSVTIGDAHLTPYAVEVRDDTSKDGLLAPGESASLFIRVLNAGPFDVGSASATLVAPDADLTDDGVVNPVAIAVAAATSPYGTIPGTVPSGNCEPLVLQPASNAVAFQVSIPADHPGDTSRPFTLQFSGTVNGGPFSMDVPVALGIADVCDFAAGTGDFDGLDGLNSPMARLVPAGDPVPFPSGDFTAGNTRPLRLRMSCGGVNLTDADVEAPEIVALSEESRGPLDIRNLNLNDDGSTNPNDPFFRFNSSLSGGQWAYNVRTTAIGTGRFTLTIRLAGRKDYVTGFVLR